MTAGTKAVERGGKTKSTSVDTKQTEQLRSGRTKAKLSFARRESLPFGNGIETLEKTAKAVYEYNKNS